MLSGRSFLKLGFIYLWSSSLSASDGSTKDNRAASVVAFFFYNLPFIFRF